MDRKAFDAIFKQLWWSVMDYDPREDKIAVYYRELRNYDIEVVKRAADSLAGSSEAMPKLEQWRYQCWQLSPRQHERDIEATPREKELSKIMRPYYSGKVTAEDTLASYEKFGERYGINDDLLSFLKQQSGKFQIGRDIPDGDKERVS